MRKYKQHDERDCGAACFATILSHYGTDILLQEAKEKVKVNIQGTNIFNIVTAGREMNLNTEAYKVNYNELHEICESKKINLPCIAHIVNEENFEHFVVILKVKKNYIKIFDPAKGNIRYTFSNFCRLWTGYIIDFSKSQNYVPFSTKNKYKTNSFYIKVIKTIWKQYIGAFILATFVVIISLIGTLGYEVVVDGVVYDFFDNNTEIIETSHDEKDSFGNEEVPNFGALNEIIHKVIDNIPSEQDLNLKVIAKVLIGLYIVQFWIQIFRDLTIGFLSKKIDLKFMNLYTKKIFKLPINFFQNITSGELLSRFSDLAEIRNLISGYSIEIIFDMNVFVLGSMMMYLINPLLFFLMMGIAIFYALLIIGFSFSISKINMRYLSKNAKTITDFKELTDGIATIKYNNSYQLIYEKLQHDFLEVTKTRLISNIIYSVQNSCAFLLDSLGMVITLCIGAKLVLDGKMTIGYLMTFSMLISYMLIPIKDIVELQPKIQKAIVSFKRLNDVMYAKEEKNEIKIKPELLGNIVFENVSYYYDSSISLLESVSFSVSHGEKILITGENGSGKSTLFKLLLVVYKPQRGRILINNYDINDLSVSFLRDNIVYVPQDIFIFSETIKNNITMGNDYDAGLLKKILETTQLTEVIQQVPNGLDTYLYENGNNLSGGQKQRIVIARALIKKPKVLILDESINQIDEITCCEIVKNIKRNFPNLTLFLISHNSSLKKYFDREISI